MQVALIKSDEREDLKVLATSAASALAARKPYWVIDEELGMGYREMKSASIMTKSSLGALNSILSDEVVVVSNAPTLIIGIVVSLGSQEQTTPSIVEEEVCLGAWVFVVVREVCQMGCHIVWEIYSLKLPGNPKLGEGKPDHQNHVVIFTRGNAVQTIDMNQDNYFEEALKMRNLLEEFHSDHGLRPPTILGVREHVFTGSVSSLASFMSSQETSFLTMGQRVLASPLKVRMHYGHPDVFDRIFHITRGGISKASRVINISEDIYSENLLVGKGRDVGLNQISLFEGKVSGGNGEQVLSRDVYRLGQLFDFFRMMSFYFTTVGYYFCTMVCPFMCHLFLLFELTVLTVYAFLYGKAYLVALIKSDEREDLKVLATSAASALAARKPYWVIDEELGMGYREMKSASIMTKSSLGALNSILSDEVVVVSNAPTLIIGIVVSLGSQEQTTPSIVEVTDK
ncbi:hypothetical protein V8G54_013713 [Vigna mungo]|uniref:Glycosyl transferase 48 domain-containing protein n=1 Tax=Vigna mungo TaxID=3915 RepID=A0AAQ3RXZ2_VIGMU